MTDDLLQIVEKRAAASLLHDETYTDENGVIRCAVCKEPRTAFIEALGKEMPVSCSCYERGEADRKRMELVAYVTQKAEEAKHLYDNSYNQFTFSADDRPETEASKMSRSYVDHWEEMEKENFGLLFSGSVGRGKSFYASCIVNALRAHGVSTLILTTSRMINVMQSSRDPQSVIDKLNTFRLVALDDLGAERDTDYAVEQIENFVNDRILSNKPLIVTTNMTGKELSNPPDLRYARIFDRVMVMCPQPIVLTGESRRAEQRKDRAGRIKKILCVR